MYFAVVYISIPLVEYLSKSIEDSAFMPFLSLTILLALGFALMWTYLSLGAYFYGVFI